MAIEIDEIVDLPIDGHCPYRFLYVYQRVSTLNRDLRTRPPWILMIGGYLGERKSKIFHVIDVLFPLVDLGG